MIGYDPSAKHHFGLMNCCAGQRQGCCQNNLSSKDLNNCAFENFEQAPTCDLTSFFFRCHPKQTALAPELKSAEELMQKHDKCLANGINF